MGDQLDLSTEQVAEKILWSFSLQNCFHLRAEKKYMVLKINKLVDQPVRQSVSSFHERNTTSTTTRIKDSGFCWSHLDKPHCYFVNKRNK